MAAAIISLTEKQVILRSYLSLVSSNEKSPYPPIYTIRRRWFVRHRRAIRQHTNRRDVVIELIE